jgi:hypothetical protein
MFQSAIPLPVGAVNIGIILGSFNNLINLKLHGVGSMRNQGLISSTGEVSNRISLICIIARKNCPSHWTTVVAGSPMERRVSDVESSVRPQAKSGSAEVFK